MAWWEAEGDDYFYHKAFGQTYRGFVKSSAASGSVEWYYSGDSDTEVEMAGIAQRKVAAWNITVTYGTNGEVRTYTGGEVANSGSVITSGDVVLAEAGKDFTFMFDPDTGYYVDEVTVDSVNLGYRSTYTFENVLNNHTIHVTFGTGFPSGPFTMSYEMFGGILDTFTIGKFSESYALREPVQNRYVGSGPFSETYAITGEGYLPFDISLLYLINKHRSDNSVASVVEDPRGWLIDGCTYAVADMIANGSLTKTLVQIMGQDGANYPYLYAGGIPTIADESFTPQDIFDAWIADQDTEDLILNPDYTEIAIYVEESGGDNHIFALFAQWHPQYTVVRAEESWEVQELCSPDLDWFEFWSAAEYTKFIENSSNIRLPSYKAKLGDYYLPRLVSFSYRLSSEKPSSIQVQVVYDRDSFDEIKTRIEAGDGLSIEQVVVSQGTTVSTEVLQADIDQVEFIGGKSPRIGLVGVADVNYYIVTVPILNVSVKTIDTDGKIRLRASHPDFYLRPGCTVTYGEDSIVIGEVVVNVSSGVRQIMEVKEA
jgi:hypothetical protein